MKETSIDLIDLIRRILLHWKAIVIWMIVFAVLMDGFYYMRAVRSSSTVEESEEDVRGYKENLTEREIAEVEAEAEAYAGLQATYRETLEYCENSIKMQLDANCVPTYTMQFYIEPAEAMAAYALIAAGEDVCARIGEEAGFETDESYIQELISTNVNPNSSLDVMAGSDTETDLSISLDSSPVNLLTVTVLAPDKESCTAMAKIIEGAVEEGNADLNAAFEDASAEMIQSYYTEQANDELLKYQQNYYDSFNTLNIVNRNLTGEMTDDQLEYYYTLIDASAVEDAAADTMETASDADAEAAAVSESQTKSKLVSGRYIVLGLLIGLILVIVCIAIGYVCSRKLRVKEDLEEIYKVPLLGFLDATERKRLKGPVCRAINRLFYRSDAKFSEEERIRMICAGIRLAAEKGEMKTVYLTGSANDGETKRRIEQLADVLHDQIGSISFGGSVIYDPESLEQMTSSDGVVLVERVDYSTYEDLEKETELCKMYEVPVIGGVVVR